jgi:hypothetical protein
MICCPFRTLGVIRVFITQGVAIGLGYSATSWRIIGFKITRKLFIMQNLFDAGPGVFMHQSPAYNAGLTFTTLVGATAGTIPDFRIIR